MLSLHKPSRLCACYLACTQLVGMMHSWYAIGRNWYAYDKHLVCTCISEPASAYVYVLKCECMYCMYSGVTYRHICTVHIMCICIPQNAYVCMCMYCMYMYVCSKSYNFDTYKYSIYIHIHTHTYYTYQYIWYIQIHTDTYHTCNTFNTYRYINI